MALFYILVSIILGMSAAEPQDMSGKMLVFPRPTDTAHVRLTPSRQNLNAVTVCMRYFTDINRGTTFFSLSTPNHQNDFLIDKTTANNDFNLYVRDAESTFMSLDYKLNQWQSVCGTWDADSGLAQLWLDGKPSVLRFNSNSNINGEMIIVLGQEQDRHGGGFDINQSFVGMITDVHMWDYVLSPHLIDNYSQKFNFPEGNVLNWKSLDYQIRGKVLVQKEQQRCE